MRVGKISSKDLNEFIAECDKRGGIQPSNAALFSDFTIELKTQVDQTLDPFSDEYFNQQLKVYEELSGRKLDQNTGELTPLDVDSLSKTANPYGSSDVTSIAKHAHAVLTSLLASKLPPNAHILDLGCGWGVSSEIAAFCGAKVHGVDINPLFVDLVNRRASTRCYDIKADKMQFDEFKSTDLYDLAFFYECLHHAVKPWETLRQIGKFIKPDGKITFAGEPINTHWWKHWGLRLDALSVYCIRKFGWFENGWSEDFITQCFARAGFNLVLLPNIGLDDGIIGVSTRIDNQERSFGSNTIYFQAGTFPIPAKSERMRIVIDLQGAQGGSRHRGIGRYTMSLAQAMVRNRGNNEIIIALSGLFPDTIEPIRAAFDGILPQENICVWHAAGPTCPVESRNTLRRHAAELVREAFLESLKPDVVYITHIFEGYLDDAVHSIGLASTIPTAVTLYDLIPLIQSDYYLVHGSPYKAFYMEKLNYLKRADLYLAISDSSRKEAIDHLGATPAQVINIAAAADGHFKPVSISDTEEQSLRKRLGLVKPFIMYSGATDERKNHLRLIKAFSLLPNKLRKNHQLAIVGRIPPPHREKFEACIKQCDLTMSDVVITSGVSDQEMVQLYNLCKLFVFPSWHEGFGLPAIEAMSCGAPVIGSNTSSLPEVIGRDDALFDPFDEKSITKKMAEVLTNDRFREDLARHGLEQSRKFSWDESAKRALHALQRFDPLRKSSVSPLLTVEKTSVYARQRLKILAIKLDHLGDFLLAIPAFAKLKARYPHATIDIIVGSWNVPIAERLGIFDRIFTYDFFKRESSKFSSPTAHIPEALLAGLDKYDIAIDFRWYPDSRFLLAETDANLKVGYQTFEPTIDEKLDVALRAYNNVPFKATPLNKTSSSRQMIALVDALPGDANDFIALPEIAGEKAREQGTIAIFPKAGLDVKEWKISNFTALVDMFLANPLVRKINIYFANKNEATEFSHAPTSKLHVHIGLTIPELTESLAKNEVCIGNNSGGVHLASYLGVASIGIYSGHELASEWGPQFNHGYVIHREASCAPCHGAKRSDCPYDLFCLSEISVADVYTIALDALGKCSGQPDGIGEKNAPILSLQKNNDSIVRNLIDSLAKDTSGYNDNDIAALADAISKNFPTYTLSSDLKSIEPNALIDHQSDLVEWRGFSKAYPEFRWTIGNFAEMRFHYPVNLPSSGMLSLFFNTLGKQRIIAHFNGKSALDEVLEGIEIKRKISVSNIQGGMNTLAFTLPNARLPGNGDGRRLAMAIKAIKVETSGNA